MCEKGNNAHEQRKFGGAQNCKQLLKNEMFIVTLSPIDNVMRNIHIRLPIISDEGHDPREHKHLYRSLFTCDTHQRGHILLFEGKFKGKLF